MLTIRNVKNFLDHKLLTINIDKTFYIPFSCNKTKLPSFEKININSLDNNYEILPKTEIKYLGVIIDQNLRWDSHINYIIKKLRFILYKFGCLQKILGITQMKSIYHALVESHLNYGILGWGGVAKTHLTALESIQKRFLKIMMSKNYRYSSDLLYIEARVFDIREMFYFQANVKQHSQKNLTLPTYSYNTRQKNNYVCPLMLKTIGQRSYQYLSPKLYNTVPEEIKSITRNSQFKRKLKKFMLEKDRKIFTDYIDIKNN